MNKLIKENISQLKTSATLAINEECKNLEKEGKKIFKFGFGQSPFPIPNSVVEALKTNAHENYYQSMQGLEKLRISVANYMNKKNGTNFQESNIIIGPGTKELMFLIHILFNGEIILSAPSWVSYQPQAIIGRNKVHWIQTTSTTNWFPTTQQIEDKVKSIKNKNLILFINSPNNPSGTLCKNLEEIAKVAKKYDLIIISDEIYSELTFNGSYKSISNFYPEKTIISTGLSKWCGAGGWRLGFFAIPTDLKKIKDSLKILCSESFTSVNAPTQYAAIEAYTGDHSEYVSKVKKILFSVGTYVYKNLKSNKININKPEGGFYLFPELNSKNFSSSIQMCKNILKDTGVALLPGSDFGLDKKKLVFRLSYTDFRGEVFMKNKLNNINDEIISEFAPKIVEGTKRLKEWVESN